MRLLSRLCRCAVVVPLAMGVSAMLQAAPRSDELARIQGERRDVAARFTAASSACQAQFIVTSCLDQARHDRRAALEDLNRQQQVLNDAQRRDRAAQRAQSIAQKAEQADARDQAPAASPSEPATAAAAASAPSGRAEKAKRKKTRAAPDARKAERAERRRLEAEQHRRDVEKRNAEAQRKRPPAAGLPVPGVASAPR